MSLESVLMVDPVDIGGTQLKQEDLLSDELVGLMNNLHHTVSTIDEDDPLYQQHLAFRNEIENRPIMLALDDIKFEDVREDSAIDNVTFMDTDRVVFENVEGIDESWFMWDTALHPANYAMPVMFFNFFGKSEKDHIIKYKDMKGHNQEYILMNQRFVPEPIQKHFKGKLYTVEAA